MKRAESRSESEEETERERAEVTTLPTRIKQNVIKLQGEQLSKPGISSSVRRLSIYNLKFQRNIALTIQIWITRRGLSLRVVLVSLLCGVQT